MDVGLQMVFASYGWANASDKQVRGEEIDSCAQKIALAKEIGMDGIVSASMQAAE